MMYDCQRCGFLFSDADFATDFCPKCGSDFIHSITSDEILELNAAVKKAEKQNSKIGNTKHLINKPEFYRQTNFTIPDSGDSVKYTIFLILYFVIFPIVEFTLTGSIFFESSSGEVVTFTGPDVLRNYFLILFSIAIVIKLIIGFTNRISKKNKKRRSKQVCKKRGN